jgi:hypothetical protein
MIYAGVVFKPLQSIFVKVLIDEIVPIVARLMHPIQGLHVVENHPRDLRMSTNIQTETESLQTSECRLSREHLPEHCHVSF